MDDQFNTPEFNEKLIEEVLSAYPDKAAKRRKKHLDVAKDKGEMSRARP
jgi:nitrogenase molybdenum-iron protein alpha chain